MYFQDLEVSLKAWEEKQRISGSHTKQLTLLADEELPVLAALSSSVSTPSPRVGLGQFVLV